MMESENQTLRHSEGTSTNSQKYNTQNSRNSRSSSGSTRSASSAGRKTSSAAVKNGSARRKKRPEPTWRKVIHWALFPFVLVYSDIMLAIFTGTGLRAFFLVLLFDIAAGLILSAITCLFKRQINRYISMAVMFVIAVYFTLQCSIYNSFPNYMSLGSILAGAKNAVGGYGSNVSNAVVGAIPKLLVFCIPLILYFLLGKRFVPAKRYKWPIAVGLVVLSLLVFGISVLFTSIGKFKDPYGATYNYDVAVRTFGVPTATRLDLKYSIFGNSAARGFKTASAEPENIQPAVESETIPPEQDTAAVEEEASAKPVQTGQNIMTSVDFEAAAAAGGSAVAELNSYVQSLTPSNKNEYTGLFAGKNLILICAEAFSDAVIDPDLTPTLYRLQHNGFYFSDFYQPAWGGSTTTGEYSMVMGLFPYDSVEIMYDCRFNNNYFTMGNQLQRLNYFNIAFHNGEDIYYHRDETHANLGYERFLAYGNGLENIDGGWMPDYENIDATSDIYIGETPFSVYYMTLSGHASYFAESYYVSAYYDTVNSIVGDKYGEVTKYYLCCQYDLELALRNLIEKLEAAGIADDTVICMTGDHYPYGLDASETWGNDRDYIEDLYQGPDYEYWERDHNALILWSGCLENEYKDMAVEISTPTYSLDILPTLSNLFGVEYDSRMLVGRDVFSDQEPLVFWPDGSWVTTRGKYDAEDDIYFPDDGGERDDSYLRKIADLISDKKYYSIRVAEIDYFGCLFGEDNDVGRAFSYFDDWE